MDEDEQPFTLCPLCQRRIKPNESGAVYAVKQVETLTMGPTRTSADGMGGWFHEGCSPEAVGYGRRQPPDASLA